MNVKGTLQHKRILRPKSDTKISAETKKSQVSGIFIRICLKTFHRENCLLEMLFLKQHRNKFRVTQKQPG